MNYSPLIYLLQNVKKYLSIIDEKRKNSFQILQSFGISEELMENLKKQIDSFCNNYPNYVVENYDEFFENLKLENGLVDQTF